MHANDHAQAADHEARRTPTRSQSEAGGVPAGLLALHSTAGNAAVVQMLRQSGHRWAQPEQHQHGSGCGHRQNVPVEQAAVQRSAVQDVLRTGGQPLDSATRTDMEARLGADFSDVRIHNDAAAKSSAAEVGARAYTSGSHVVVGDGGADRHTLAHELTHVIQQRQGAVAGSDNGSGLKVSDPADRFERAAEANADRAMSTPAPTSDAVPERSRPGRAGFGASIQRAVVPQVGSENGQTISEIHFAGRPKSPYTGTMGDHTTAYIVQQEAVKRAVLGHTPQNAALNLQELAHSAATLPGAERSEHLPAAKRENYREAADALKATFATMATAQPAQQFLLVQKMVSEFLHFRELIPFTTMDVTQVTQGAAGKGKAEAGASQTLSTYYAAVSAGLASPVDASVARSAVWKLMDREGVAIVATEHSEETLSRLSPGMNPALSQEERSATIIKQHIQSLEMAYPHIIEHLFGSTEQAGTVFLAEMREEIEKRRRMNVEFYVERLQASTKIIEQYYARGAHHDKRPPVPYVVECDNWQRHANALRFNGESVSPPQPPAESSARASRSKAQVSSTMSDLTRIMGQAAISTGEQTGSTLLAPVAAPVSATQTSAAEEQDSEKQYLTSQIEINNGIITAFHSGGRSPSPFAGTMGAHTTAWIAHLDHIRQGIVDRSVEAAAHFILANAIPQAKHMKETMGPAFMRNDEQGSHQLVLLADAQRALGELAAELNAVSVGARQGDQIATARQPLILQKTINALLTYTNFIPGATLEATDVGGKHEGGTRRELLAHEAGTDSDARTLQVLLMKLMDVPRDANEAQLAALVKNHLAIVRGAYPKSFTASKLTESDALKTARKSAERS
ncbi:DUF4157 domain-containing protein [Streptomyces sp. NPDC048416]|uniref:eCIS core domain-containing protein n=1 Tax=Streptomyces sp. NPDC048416 TaxID=3365546 RepID=UPI00370FC30C